MAFTAVATTVPFSPQAEAVKLGHLVFSGVATTLPMTSGASPARSIVMDPPGEHIIETVKAVSMVLQWPTHEEGRIKAHISGKKIKIFLVPEKYRLCNSSIRIFITVRFVRFCISENHNEYKRRYCRGKCDPQGNKEKKQCPGSGKKEKKREVLNSLV